MVLLSDHSNIWEDSDIDIDLSECGVTKGCFYEPKACVEHGEECTIIATWREQGDHFVFETDFLIPAAYGDHFWSAIGFSHDKHMVCFVCRTNDFIVDYKYKCTLKEYF